MCWFLNFFWGSAAESVWSLVYTRAGVALYSSLCENQLGPRESKLCPPARAASLLINCSFALHPPPRPPVERLQVQAGRRGLVQEHCGGGG